ncbi:RNA polymerase sigma factor [Cupriavidus pauculus]|nr:sigma-70 family RNA polymerase sigma factor [Cupriavidus pauculus]
MLQQVEPMIPALRRYARALMKERGAAADLVQDCLERVITHWDDRRLSADTRSWVFAILHNLVMSAFRKNTSAGNRQVAIEDVAESLSTCATQEDGLIYQDLIDAVDTISPEQRSVLLLISLEDMSYAEVAKTLDIPIGTVMSRLSRARDRLIRLVRGTRQDAGPIAALRHCGG